MSISELREIETVVLKEDSSLGSKVSNYMRINITIEGKFSYLSFNWNDKSITRKQLNRIYEIFYSVVGDKIIYIELINIRNSNEKNRIRIKLNM